MTLGGHPVLQGISTQIAAGTHGGGWLLWAGKSTLVGLLLGFHPVSSGQVLLNGVAVQNDALVQLRSSVAWVDPDVRLWNRSLFDNLHYAQASDRVDALGRAIETADLTRGDGAPALGAGDCPGRRRALGLRRRRPARGLADPDADGAAACAAR